MPHLWSFVKSGTCSSVRALEDDLEEELRMGCEFRVKEDVR